MPPPCSVHHPSHILVILPQWVGDCVMVTSSLRILRENLPSSVQVTLFCLKHIKPLLQDELPLIGDDMLTYQKDELKGVTLFRSAEKLRKQNVDAVILLASAFRPALLSLLAGIPKRYGYATDYRSFLLTDAVPGRENISAGVYVNPFRTSCELIQSFLLTLNRKTPTAFSLPELHISTGTEKEYRKVIPDRREQVKQRVGIITASSYGSSRMWKNERMAQLADRLIRWGYEVSFLHGPGEEKITEEIVEMMEEKEKAYIPPVLPLDLLKAFIRECDLIISADTGPRHIAAALKVPSLILMGATSASIATIPGVLTEERIQKTTIPCVPCNQPVCKAESHLCMETITVEEVFQKSRAILQKGR